MEIVPTAIPEVKILVPKRIGDHRGFFSETYSARALAAAGIHHVFVQDNHSMSVERGVLRGLHFQIAPHAQVKLVRVVRGAAFDVAVDIRRSSPTFGRHVHVILSAEEWNQVLIPHGFAHGYCTLEPNTELVYKVDDYYAPECERGILWNDPLLGIPWPVAAAEAILSEKDARGPRWDAVPDLFA